VHPIGTLEPGESTVVARSFDIRTKLDVLWRPLGNFDEIDFPAFRQDPLGDRCPTDFRWT
jgi:hypothetical protein